MQKYVVVRKDGDRVRYVPPDDPNARGASLAQVCELTHVHTFELLSCLNGFSPFRLIRDDAVQPVWAVGLCVAIALPLTSCVASCSRVVYCIRSCDAQKRGELEDDASDGGSGDEDEDEDGEGTEGEGGDGDDGDDDAETDWDEDAEGDEGRDDDIDSGSDDDEDDEDDEDG